jgi:hypothetical protein
MPRMRTLSIPLLLLAAGAARAAAPDPVALANKADVLKDHLTGAALTAVHEVTDTAGKTEKQVYQVLNQVTTGNSPGRRVSPPKSQLKSLCAKTTSVALVTSSATVPAGSGARSKRMNALRVAPEPAPDTVRLLEPPWFVNGAPELTNASSLRVVSTAPAVVGSTSETISMPSFERISPPWWDRREQWPRHGICV